MFMNIYFILWTISQYCFFVVWIVLALAKSAMPFQCAPCYLSTSDLVSPQILLDHLIFLPSAQESIT